ncbi:MAG: hypothetical protein RLZZ292_3977 [Bacteroidota bacterium]|jgi:hypothetical protein
MAETIKGRLIYILISEHEVVGTWHRLRTLCNDRSQLETFPSYSKLSKDIAIQRNEGNERPTLVFTTKDGKSYTIQVDTLQ